ncbi:hypothetical protein [Caballeronia sp. ATUFL_F1_KS39]|uniref:hypothetical protein n=1 Tax=Caballeronia sp. ATUFL_F1_KS39 TaxID=2921766 RepID=UPI002027DEE0|nr:hypothetical protein [Caballeronia sp. ATUFL_F1_KS39]
MEPKKELEKFLDKYADLDVHETAGWPAAMVGHLAGFRRPNLAIVAVAGVVGIDAYKNLPASIIYAALVAITLLGIVGGRGNG